jgi:peptide/nickel transport system substrate-binding protein
MSGGLMPELTRRRALLLTSSGLAANLLAACSAAAPATPPPPATSTPAPPAIVGAAPATATPVAPPRAATAAAAATSATSRQVKTGGILRLGLPIDLSSLEPHILTGGHFDTIWHVWDRLIQYNSQLEPQPMLAESWEVSSDQKQIKFNLRKGVQWHSGRELTSEDVKWNLVRVRDPKIAAAQLASLSNFYQEFETPDKYTIVFKSDTPRQSSATFDYLEFFNMAEPESLQGPDAKTKAVGTGPFMFTEWMPGAHLSLARNPNYWQSGRPYLDGMRVSVGLDAQTMVTQFEAGALDAMRTAPVRDFVRLKADPTYQSLVHPNTGAMYFMGVNVAAPPLDDKRVRQALNYAINRERFTDTVLQGISGPPFSLPWNAAALAYEEGKRNFYTFDLDKAAALLKAAGVTKLDVDIVAQVAPSELVDFQTIYQSDLARIGINLNTIQLTSASWQAQMTPRKYMGNERYLFTTGTQYAQLKTPVMMFTSSPLWTTSAANQEGFHSERYTQLVNDLVAGTDTAALRQTLSHINDLILDESFMIMFASNPPRITLRPAMQGVTTVMHEAFTFTDTWFDA